MLFGNSRRDCRVYANLRSPWEDVSCLRRKRRARAVSRIRSEVASGANVVHEGGPRGCGSLWLTRYSTLLGFTQYSTLLGNRDGARAPPTYLPVLPHDNAQEHAHAGGSNQEIDGTTYRRQDAVQSQLRSSDILAPSVVDHSAFDTATSPNQRTHIPYNEINRFVPTLQ